MDEPTVNEMIVDLQVKAAKTAQVVLIDVEEVIQRIAAGKTPIGEIHMALQSLLLLLSRANRLEGLKTARDRIVT